MRFSIALGLLALCACGTKLDPLDADLCRDFDAGPVTWTEVQPIIETSCSPCHSASSTDRHNAPTSTNFDTYREAKKRAGRIAARVTALSMPPDEAERAGFPLPDTDQRCTLAAWAEQGAPQ